MTATDKRAEWPGGVDPPGPAAGGAASRESSSSSLRAQRPTTTGATSRPLGVERIPAVLDVPALAALLGMTVAGARALCRRGYIRATVPRGTRAYRIRGADVVAWLESGATPVPEQEARPVALLRGLAPPRRGRRNLRTGNPKVDGLTSTESTGYNAT